MLDVLHQAGAARARFPRVGDGAPPEAVLLNMAGGLTGGDRIDIGVTLAEGAAATVTTAAAEKIYRARDGDATIRTSLELAAGASLAWLPQTTILFDRSRLDRSAEVAMAADARLLAVEIVTFGRAAMGEDVRHGAVRDAWRVRRAGKLVFADTLHVDGAIADVLDRRAVLDGTRALAMLLYVAPDAETRVTDVRAALEGARSVAGVSAWNGLLLVRALAPQARVLVEDLAPLVVLLGGRPLPRVWQF
jgi:urease accessory protein